MTPAPPERGLPPVALPLLVTFAVLTVLAVIALYVLAARTDEFFAWTIHPPVTAAFLGAGYGAGLGGVVVGLRQQRWRPVRLGLEAILVFVVLTTIATFLHLEPFHFDATGLPLVAAWLWLLVYVAVPVWIVVVLVRTRAPQTADPRMSAWPRLLRPALWGQTLVLAVLGSALFLAPGTADVLWPWPLSPLTARATSAWVLTAAATSYLAVRQHGPADVDIVLAMNTTFVVLVGAALLRFRDQVAWADPAATGLVVLLAVMLATGLRGSLRRPVVAAP